MAVQRLSNSGRSGFSYKSLIAGITPLPSVPTIGAATAVTYSSVNVAFTAPGAYAGSTYTATSSPGGLTGTSASSPILVTGLSESTAYTFTVTATNATGTSGASAASDAVTTPAGDTGVMYPIQMVSVGAAGAAYVDFTSIPSTYTHLQVRMTAKSQRANNYGSTVWAYFNGDYAPSSPTNYNFHFLSGDGSTASSGAYPNTNVGYGAYAGNAMGTTATNVVTVNIMDILDYKNTNKYKTVRTLFGEDRNGGGQVALYSSLWQNTAAITSIRFYPDNYNFAQYTSIALYGIKGA